ncbi:MAG TPA: hypothetical protein VN461_17560 [Vicinamibacteria bacterium]|nr:hypothetical protein [Vicinamibacteria bacterium]
MPQEPAAQDKVVARYQDGRLLKGFTTDFLPEAEVFHLSPVAPTQGATPVEVRVAELKALFFVREFQGRPDYSDRKEFDPARPPVGRKVRVIFKDGELILGTTPGYQPDHFGFFVVPADPRSNIERCFVVSSATRDVTLL